MSRMSGLRPAMPRVYKHLYLSLQFVNIFDVRMRDGDGVYRVVYFLYSWRSKCFIPRFSCSRCSLSNRYAFLILHQQTL